MVEWGAMMPAWWWTTFGLVLGVGGGMLLTDLDVGTLFIRLE